MSATPGNAAQIDYWNAANGLTWAQFQVQLDRQLSPLGEEAMRALEPRAGERILDIGCGCGDTTLTLAARVGPSGRVVGVDISEPMLAVARARGAGAVDFREVDAQTGDLGAEAFAAAFSRFGVMFFENPPAAFANIRKSLKRGGRLAFVCWRPFAENPWMRAPMEAALPFLPPQPPPADPYAPGPFAFADAARTRGILEGVGFTEVSVTTFDTCIGGAPVDAAMDLAFRIGPLGVALREHPEARSAVADAVRALMQAHATPDGVLMPAAVWIVTAIA